MTELKKVFEFFNTESSYISAEPYGSGHIHDTFKVETAGNSPDYILQKLNNYIFKDISALQENIGRVTRHLRIKLEEQGVEEIDRRCLTLIPTHNGESFIQDDDGLYWRLYIFIRNHKSYDVVETSGQAYQGGRAIGRFQALLADLPGKPLNETIPDFHNISSRLNSFHYAIRRDPKGRIKNLEKEINFVTAREEIMHSIIRLGQDGEIPLRTTHNDTKFNNVLLDANDEALCVIDLDTVMPGYIHYDFGDAIRTAANSAAEDETDLSKVFLRTDLFEAYARGYLEEMKETLNPTEKEYLAFAPRLITFTIGLRFLTDYIDGDNYFKIHHKEHNLERARAQFKLVESNEEQYENLKGLISKLSE